MTKSIGMRLFSILIFITLTYHQAHTQDLTKYRWQNRLLVVLADSIDSLEEQIQKLDASKKGLKERKLLVILAMPDQFRIGIETSEWQHGDQLYQKFKRSKSSIEIVLLGLDGGIKERYEGKVDTADIFKIIDQMPMRKAEIRTKGL